MKQVLSTMLACAVTLTVQPACAQVGGPSNDTMKAELLQAACNAPSSMDKVTRDLAAELCNAYFRGLTDGLFLMKTFSDDGNAGCLPSGAPISNAEARGDFELFLKDHPEAAKNSAALIAVYGIMRAHPCPR
jgi:hypothetical protein